MILKPPQTLKSTLIAFAMFCISCSTETDYSAGNKTIPSSNNKTVAAEAADAQPKDTSTGEFFKQGKSLDLYVVMDKSGSLWGGWSLETGTIKASDPDCLRLEALLDLVDKLKGFLTQKEAVRLNVITFGTTAATAGNITNALSLSRAELDARLRAPVCDKPPLEDRSTMYSDALELISTELAVQRVKQKFDVETAIFFSDGAAKDLDENRLSQSIQTFNSAFPKRSYAVLLGKTNDNCNITKSDGDKMSTLECITEVVGGDNERVVQSDDASKLSTSMIQLLSK